MAKIKPGMDKESVFQLLGEPEHTLELGNGDWWAYTLPKLNAAAGARSADPRTVSINFDARKRVKQCAVTRDTPEALRERKGALISDSPLCASVAAAK